MIPRSRSGAWKLATWLLTWYWGGGDGGRRHATALDVVELTSGERGILNTKLRLRGSRGADVDGAAQGGGGRHGRKGLEDIGGGDGGDLIHVEKLEGGASRGEVTGGGGEIGGADAEDRKQDDAAVVGRDGRAARGVAAVGVDVDGLAGGAGVATGEIERAVAIGNDVLPSRGDVVIAAGGRVGMERVTAGGGGGASAEQGRGDAAIAGGAGREEVDVRAHDGRVATIDRADDGRSGSLRAHYGVGHIHGSATTYQSDGSDQERKNRQAGKGRKLHVESPMHAMRVRYLGCQFGRHSRGGRTSSRYRLENYNLRLSVGV